jgi:hypothetical protein
VKDIFFDWLDRTFPGKKARVLARVRSVRNGKLYDFTFGVRGSGEGIFAEQIAALFKASARRNGLDGPRKPLSTAAFRRPGPQQLEMPGLLSSE